MAPSVSDILTKANYVPVKVRIAGEVVMPALGLIRISKTKKNREVGSMSLGHSHRHLIASCGNITLHLVFMQGKFSLNIAKLN